MAPKISIIVPAYNEEKYISRCLDSILAQTFSDFEVICVDDGSTDNTFTILTEYSEKDSRIIPLKNTGKGVSSARNFGIDNSNGEYIGFVDSDDFIQPQTLEFFFRTFSENKADMVICGCNRTFDISPGYFEYRCRDISCTELINSNNIDSFLCVWTKMVKKELVKDRIFFEKYKIGEDTLFCSNLWINSDCVFYIDLPMYNYFINPDGVFSNNLSNEKWLDQLKTHYQAYLNFKNYKEILVPLWFLENGIKFLLSYKLFSKKNKNKTNREEIKSLYKKYFTEYKKCKSISTANKIYVFISYHFPLLYEVRRKLLDKTIR